MSKLFPFGNGATVLISVLPDTTSKKKYIATFLMNDGSIKKVKFGAKGYGDYTIGTTDQQRSNYWKRHAKDYNVNGPTTAGMLSLFILWGSSRNINTNIAKYKQMFDL